jgi:hypothetical protein
VRWRFTIAIGPTFWVAVQFESEAVEDGETIAGMDVWLQTAGAAKGESFGSRLVHSPQHATAMTQNNAREAMQGAKREYPDYTWEMEAGFNSGEFVVHGQKK